MKNGKCRRKSLVGRKERRARRRAKREARRGGRIESPGMVAVPSDLSCGCGGVDDPRIYSERLQVRALELLRSSLASTSLDVTAEEIAERLQSWSTPHDAHHEVAFRGPDGRAYLERSFCRIQELWNYTPRAEIGGRCPADHFVDLLEAGASDRELRGAKIHIPDDWTYPLPNRGGTFEVAGWQITEIPSDATWEEIAEILAKSLGTE